MSLPNLVHLVDIHGHDVSSTERAVDPEPDPPNFDPDAESDPAYWPAQYDDFYWTISDYDEVDRLLALGTPEVIDRVDAPTPATREETTYAEFVREYHAARDARVRAELGCGDS
jgi:hypothetical protein